MNLSKRLLTSFGAMLGLVLLLSAAALLVTRDLGGELDRVANVTARQQYLAGLVNAGASELTSLERGNVLAAMLGDASRADAYRQQFTARSEGLLKALADLNKMAESKAEGARLQTLNQQAALVTQAHEEMRQAMANQQMDQGMAIFAQRSSLSSRK